MAGRWLSPGTPTSSNKNWPPQYNWNSVEVDVKHHNPNHIPYIYAIKKMHSTIVDVKCKVLIHIIYDSGSLKRRNKFPCQIRKCTPENKLYVENWTKWFKKAIEPNLLDILRGKGKKRSEYGHYTPKQKTIVARYAILHWNDQSSRTFYNENILGLMEASYLLQ